jgi:tRNA threonylcarbamoyladenosine biosynthesis protein TsaB
MKILGIETSGSVGGVALSDDERLLGEITFRKGMIHGRALIPAVERLLRKLKAEPRDVGAVAVSSGPGSYTGVRVGVTCAKAVCYATGAKLVAVPTLDAMVQNVPKKFSAACPVIDARRGDVYACLYTRSDGEWRHEGEYTAEPPDIIASKLPPGACVFGSGLVKYASIFSERGFNLAPERNWWGKARNVCALAALACREGRFEDPFTFTPRYLRPTEAELNLMKSRRPRSTAPRTDEGVRRRG